MSLAVFDLDGTITRRDSLVQYVLGLLCEKPWQLLRLLRVAPALGAYLCGRMDRGALKARLLLVTVGDRTRAELDAWTRRFVARLLARGAYADAFKAIETHRARGDLLVLLSASPDLYVPVIGTELRFDEVLCTGLHWRSEHLDGLLTTANRRGAEKTRCVQQLKLRYPGVHLAAYANAHSDLDHLRQTDTPVLVNGSGRTRREAARLGIRCERWH